MVAVTREHLAFTAVAYKRRALKTLPWREWTKTHFPTYTTAPFADRHVRFWDWISSLEPGVRPRARVEVWPRGGGKSSTVELGCAYLGSSPNPARHLALYVSETQEQANLHVQAIAAMLEKVGVKRAVNQYNASKGWRMSVVRAANGFNLMAFGLDAGMRGIKLDEFRPDLIVFDDIDGRHDSKETTNKKINTITTSILPTGSADCAVIVVQNKIAKDSIVSQLADGRADFLHDRIPATVEPAVIGLKYEQIIQEDGSPKYKITGGDATWDGQSLATCELQLNDWGISAFEREAQHNVDDVDGGLWDRGRDIEPFRLEPGHRIPPLRRIVVAIDPSTTATGDEAGIIVGGVSNEWNERMWPQPHAYILDDVSLLGSPKEWADAAVRAYHKWQADALVAERNNGGDMVTVTINTVTGAPPVTLVWASKNKTTRAEPVQKIYQDGRVHHTATFHQLEREQCVWEPGTPSPNRMDALVWCLTELMLDGGKELRPVSGDVAAYLNSQFVNS